MQPAASDRPWGRWYPAGPLPMAWGCYSDGYAPNALWRPKGVSLQRNVEHHRHVIMVHGIYWLVLDLLDASTGHTYTWHWHGAPDLDPRHGEGGVDFHDPSADLALRIQTASPVGNLDWTVISGREQPIQGWYSPDHHRKDPAPVAESRLGAPGAVAALTLLAAGPMAELPRLEPLKGAEDGRATWQVTEPQRRVDLRLDLPNQVLEVEFVGAEGHTHELPLRGRTLKS